MIEFAPFGRGFGLSLGLIAAIGAQNAYVLTRGILRNHHFAVAAVCSVLDTILIFSGVLGMGKVVAAYPQSITVLTLFGALFLFAYGGTSFRRMMQSQALRADHQIVTLKTAILTMVTLSLFNPHLYLDTVVLLGSVSVQELPENRLTFAAGACLASITWFFMLALGGQWMQRWFQTPAAWRLLDGFVGVVMWSLAIMLVKDMF
ncbi:MAG: LysE/ArgO family amino acid transporter [Acidiferrobacterales bacterium]|nr:LysE/ArgO family amino acid transporter [Acidiferrobacterales bacterium]